MRTLRRVGRAPHGPSLALERTDPIDGSAIAVECIGDAHVALYDKVEVRIWEEQSGLIRRFPALSGPGSVVPNAACVLFAHMFEVNVVDASTDAAPRCIVGMGDPAEDEILAVAALSSRELVTWSREQGLEFRAMDTGIALRSAPLTDPGDPVDGVCRLVVHPDGQGVLAFVQGSARDLFLWDTRNGDTAVIEVHDEVSAVALTTDGQRIAIASRYEVTVWDLAAVRAVSSYDMRGEIRSLAWLGDYLVVIGDERGVLVDANGEELWADAALRGDAAVVRGDSLYVARAGALSRWRLTQSQRRFDRQGSTYRRVTADAAGRGAIVSGWRLPARLWDIATGLYLAPWSCPSDEDAGGVTRVEGDVLAVDEHRRYVYDTESIAVFDARTGGIVAGVHAHDLDGGGGPGSVQEISASGERVLLAFPPHGALRVHALADNRCWWCTADAGNQLTAAAFVDRDGAVVATGHSDGALRVWDVERGACTRVIDTGSPVTCIVVEGARLFAGHATGEIDVWCVATGARLGGWLAHAAPITSLAVDPRGEAIAAASGRVIRAWQWQARDAGPGEPLCLGEWSDHPDPQGLTLVAGRALFVSCGELVVLE
jgi:WD40 repeat protein